MTDNPKTQRWWSLLLFGQRCLTCPHSVSKHTRSGCKACDCHRGYR